jgi:hypothetical protein
VNKVLQELNSSTRVWTIKKFRKVDFRCMEATQHLVRGSKGALVHYSGFHGWTTHNWAVDPVTGDIYDPTMEQFGYEFVPVIEAGTHASERYRGTPQDEVQYWAPLRYPGLEDFFRYKSFQTRAPQGYVKYGHDSVELKTAKNGKQYMLLQRSVKLTCLMNIDIRSATIWRAKNGGFNAYVILQQVVYPKSGGVTFPTKRCTYFIPENEVGLIRLKKGKWGDVIKPQKKPMFMPIMEAINKWKEVK